MNRKQGFSILELLAVVVLLSIIALIAFPQVLGLITESQKGAFRTGAESLVKSAMQAHTEMMYDKKITQNVEFNVTTGENMNKLDVEGDMPTAGKIIINLQGLAQVRIKNDEYCAIKEFTDERVKVYKITDSKCNSIS